MSYLSLKRIVVAHSNCILVMKLPFRTTDILLPLYKCCFRPIKMLSDNNSACWKRVNVNKMSPNVYRGFQQYFNENMVVRDDDIKF